jgi:teichuronic acid biosynthesis glycosyltransferase TuaC
MYPGLNPGSPHTGIFVQDQVESLKKLGATFELIKIDSYKGRLAYLKSIFIINWRLLRDRSFDIIHIHYGLSGLFLLFNLTIPRSKLVLTLHGSDIAITSKKYIQRFISRQLARRVGNVILVNKGHILEVKKSNAKIFVVPCGVDTEFFRPDPATRRANRIIFPSASGRPEKNFALFLEVFQSLQTELAGLEYRCLDGMTRNEVRSALLESSLLLMTSTSEGSPQVVKEALACDMPVVSVDVGDVKLLLDGPTNSFVSTTYQAQELANLCKKALSMPASPGSGLKRLTELGMDSSSIAKRVLAIYSAASSS